MNKMSVKADLIPKRKREQLAAPLLSIVRKAFEDPEIQKEFEEWKARKAAAEEAAS